VMGRQPPQKTSPKRQSSSYNKAEAVGNHARWVAEEPGAVQQPRSAPPPARRAGLAAQTPEVRGTPTYTFVRTLHRRGISLLVKDNRVFYPKETPEHIAHEITARTSECLEALRAECPGCRRTGYFQAEIFICSCGVALIRTSERECVMTSSKNIDTALARIILQEVQRPIGSEEAEEIEKAIVALRDRPGWESYVAYARARWKIFGQTNGQ
jgi:hypothetical protein